MSALVRALHRAHELSIAPEAARFRRALLDPEAAQRARLRAVLAQGADTAFGREHGLERARGASDAVAALRARVPVQDAASLAPWVERAAAGEQGVLTREPVRFFERTSGTSAANKLVPMTASFLAELSAATSPWLADLGRAFPSTRTGRHYWAISPVTREAERTPGGAPIGATSDTEYLGPLLGALMERVLAVPSSVARIADVDAWRRETARALVAAEDLALVSVWSPSFLTLLMDAIERELDGLLRALPSARAAAIRTRLEREGALVGEALWPRLALVSTWDEGPAAALVPALRARFPRTIIQGKGLLATEGVISIPLAAHREGAVVAVRSHFLEWLDLDAPSRPPLLTHELRIGGAYSPLLTTGGGLRRYHLRDVVRCTGFFARTPSVRFEGRLDGTSDVAGEKLAPAVAERAVREALEAHAVRASFVLLAPDPDHAPPRYVLYVDAELTASSAALASALEGRLAEGAHYAYCRRLGQLGPAHVVVIERGAATFERAMHARGMRLGDIKPGVLQRGAGWGTLFARRADASEIEP